MNMDSFTFGEQAIVNLRVLYWYKILGSHRRVAEDSCLLECYTISLGKQLPMFQGQQSKKYSNVGKQGILNR
jgi:hypothetical protein